MCYNSVIGVLDAYIKVNEKKENKMSIAVKGENKIYLNGSDADAIMIVPCNSKGDCHGDEEGTVTEEEYYKVKDQAALDHMVGLGAKAWDRWDVEEGTWESVKEFLTETGFNPATRCYKIESDQLQGMRDLGLIEKI